MKLSIFDNKIKLFFIVLSIIVIVSLVKFRNDEINYLNADATWHTLLTMEAYNETSVKTHHFLPIVSLGGEEDKYIPWGATIADNSGNYYYTSFSPASFTLAYFFVKILRLPITEQSLYLLNVCLFVVSSLIWTGLLFRIYGKEKHKKIIILIGIMTYIFSPELFHGMGVVYWAQSVMQVTLPAQILAYYIWKTDGSKRARTAFLILTLANPYIEWTGYIANVGFVFAELCSNWKKSGRMVWKSVAFIVLLTASSFMLFTLHYLSVVPTSSFFRALKDRFFARNFASETLLTDVFAGYLKSFLLLWVLLFILCIWNMVQNGKIEFRHRILMFVMIFPVLENVVMKQHALSYTYDRMKLIFVLSFLICELAMQILATAQKEKAAAWGLIMAVSVCCIGNLSYYIHDDKYIWSTDFRQENEAFADYINNNYPDSVLAASVAVRGYLNLLFGRGIYEGSDITAAIDIAVKKNKAYAIELKAENAGGGGYWNTYQIRGAVIHDVNTGKTFEADVPKKYRLADLTDANWTLGHSKNGHILLFNKEDDLLSHLSNSNIVRCNGQNYSIVDMDYDALWIRVTVDKDASQCAFPAEIILE